MRAGVYVCEWACFALRAVHTGWMQACCMSSWGRAILSLGGRAPKWTKFEQLWRLSICSDGSTSREPYVQNRHGWPCAERRRPSMPSSDRRVEQCTSHVAIVSFSILYFTRFKRVVMQFVKNATLDGRQGAPSGRRAARGLNVY